jgi:hypothetical protein
VCVEQPRKENMIGYAARDELDTGRHVVSKSAGEIVERQDVDTIGRRQGARQVSADESCCAGDERDRPLLVPSHHPAVNSTL